MADQPDQPGFLQRTYGLDTPDQVEQHYREWATTYEQELLDNGYASPARCARALAATVADRSAPLLDAGCGTGLSGLALRDAGFTTIDGYDFSPEMLALAADKTSVYRSLGTVDLSRPLPVEAGSYANACAAGVVHPGHAPVEAIGFVIDVLPTGGCFALSLSDHALTVPEFPGAVDEVVASGRADLVSDGYGPHLPGIDLGSRIIVLRRR
ncbi:MAG: methyltransferase domain-containing protein [Acidimicrobiia bacterium]|nr:methyltransferase domain-containing protein [Acidimicrobiia bacterium]